MKKILRFQLKDLIYSCLVYALVMLLLSCIPAVISIAFGDIDTNINGNGLPGAVFCLVFGIAVYKEHLLMAVQNGISRKCYFQSVLCVLVIAGCVCALIDLLTLFLGVRLGAGFSGNSNFRAIDVWKMCYPGFYDRAGSVSGAAVSFVLSAFVNFLLFASGLVTAGVYCRMAKKFRTFYCVGLPLFIFGVLPVIGAYFHREIFKLANGFMNIMGFRSNNPFLGVLTMTVIILVILFICYRLLRRTEIS